MRIAVPMAKHSDHPAVLAGDAPGVPVLMYHSIAVGAARRFRRFAVDPGEFAAQTAAAAKRVAWRALRRNVRVVGGDLREGSPT